MYLRGYLGQGTGTYPVFNITIEEYERRRAEVEREAVRLHMTTAEWIPLLPVPKGNYIHDPATGRWWRAGDITQVAWEIMPPVVGGTPGTFVNSTPLSEAEARAWIARVEASRQPLYGSPLTIPSRMGWVDTEVAAEDIWNLATQLGWPNDITKRFLESFPTKQAWIDWFVQASAHPEMWQQKVDELGLFGQPVTQIDTTLPPEPGPPPPGPPPPGSPPPPSGGGGGGGGGGNVAPPGTTPPGYRYPIIQYAPHSGTALLRSRGWQPDEIGFWLTQAFGGHLDLTEAFLLSFSGREELASWLVGKGPGDVYARADAALAARQIPAPGGGTQPPPPGTGAEETGISLPIIALGAAAIFYFTQK